MMAAREMRPDLSGAPWAVGTKAQERERRADIGAQMKITVTGERLHRAFFLCKFTE